MTAIEQLPARMDRLELQIVQFRAEMRDEFSAVRSEMAAGDEATCRSLREEIRAGDEETRRVLREEIRAGDERVMTVLSARIDDSRREARVLYEDVIGRIAVIGEGLATLSEKVDRNYRELSEKIDRNYTELSGRIDATRGETQAMRGETQAMRAETQAMFDRIMTRLDELTPKRKRSGRRNRH